MANAFRGLLCLEITSADCISLLNALNNAKIKLENVSYQSELMIHITVSKNDYDEVIKLCTKYGASVNTIGKTGIYWHIISIYKRPILIVFMITIFVLSIFLPSRILFITVEGNDTIPSNQIIEAAERCGLKFGASRRRVRSEKMKNALLFALPDLQWAGINTSGCSAVISVKEKTTQDITDEGNTQVCNIIASRDGVIRSCTVYQGNCICYVGQAVKEGQILVSGYVDCGLLTKATQAKAEINALTFREIEVITPAPVAVREKIHEERTIYRIRIGKNIINLSKDSGNLDDTCGKIYEEKYVRLPGGFQLPLSFIKQTVFNYSEIKKYSFDLNQNNWMVDFTTDYLKNMMVAGNIISQDIQLDKTNELCYLYGKFTCIEKIGQVSVEQMMIGDK